jgi:hypothetical protein
MHHFNRQVRLFLELHGWSLFSVQFDKVLQQTNLIFEKKEVE